MSFLEHALALAKKGWAVFPLIPKGKTPMLPGGFKNATTDPTRIKEWWMQWPSANIGLATGMSGLFVIDIDSADAAKELYKIMPELETLVTLRAKTSKGEHIYFKCNKDEFKSCTSFAGVKKIDIRCAGGYVVAPPSLHPSGAVYTWQQELETALVLPVPDVIRDIAVNGVRKAEAPDVSKLELETVLDEEFGEKILEGERNNRLTSFAGKLRRLGYGENAITQHLLVFNNNRCDPPLAFKELQTIAKSVCRYPAGGKTEEKIDLNFESAKIYKGDPALVELKINDCVLCCPISVFTSPRRFAAVWENKFFQTPPWKHAKSRVWDRFANSVLATAEVVDLGPQTSTEEAAKERILIGLRSAEIKDDLEFVSTATLYLYIKESDAYFNFNAIADYMEEYGFKLSRIELSRLLKECGARPGRVWDKGAKMQVRIMCISFDKLQRRGFDEPFEKDPEFDV